MLKRKEDIGLSPYELKFRGLHRSGDIRMTLFEIDFEKVNESTIRSVEELLPYKNSETLIWLNIDGLHDEKLMGELVGTLQIPADILSDVMEPGTRPQMEEFDNGLFVSIKMMELNEGKNRVSVDNLSLVVMDNLLVTFQEEKSDLFNPVRERIRKHSKRFRTLGADYLAFALLDVVIDNYIFILGGLGEKIENLENEMIMDPGRETLKIINLLKRELSNLGRYIRPAREMIIGLVKSESDFIAPVNEKHYKELQDNINQAVELLDYYRELLYDELNIYHSSMSTRLSDIMALLTIFSVIFIPLTFIVGVYGMNFDNIPELHWRYGYFIVWGVMLLIAIGMLWYFKKRKWF
ncbi:Thermotoga maritima CorA_like subfamily [Proteiniphilum saccharofermentans]|uniref:Magnesium transport protein CorA n=1 Tax=Proteiniphilum saccharofermentans TaxID=1642647 RepID=A0A1R3T4C9_9BACT|nr:magnesium/cobalt transporter CorA [Proteiniphilum saccharofermentans]SCD20138.1 Thermotoga maritima CorA_like subfamily [Proteiniphilum saccharofermentans]